MLYGLAPNALGQASQPAGTGARSLQITDAALAAKGIYSEDLKAAIRSNPEMARNYGFAVPASASTGGTGTAAAGGDGWESQFAQKAIFSEDLKAAIKADPEMQKAYGITAPGTAQPAAAPGAPGRIVGLTEDPNLKAMQERLEAIIAGGPEAYARADPNEALMAAKLERALRGEEVDPLVERTIADELEVMRNRLKQAYGTAGSEWESTVGQNLYLKGLESAAIARDQVNKNTIASVGPQQFARRTFQINNPMNQYLAELGAFAPETFRRQALRGSEERALVGQHTGAVQANAGFNETARQAGVAQTSALSSLNRPSLTTGSGILGSQWGTFGPIVGTGEPNTFPTLANAATRGFEAEQAARAATSRDVASVVGNAARVLVPKTNYSLALSPNGEAY